MVFIITGQYTPNAFLNLNDPYIIFEIILLCLVLEYQKLKIFRKLYKKKMFFVSYQNECRAIYQTNL